jgi:hypothetical protein
MTKPKKDRQLDDTEPDDDEPADIEIDPTTGLRRPSPEQTDDRNNTGALGDPVGVDF